ncbi:transposase (plasmid) [Staphylococcus xylosus]|nr:transposase [Staphylococcus xylosus]
MKKIKYICHKHNYTYGYRKVIAELNKFSEIIVSHKKYKKLCRKMD